jgi:uncharacterized membrane protein YeaQ/YmgE (transglycosylase-associated protein family)
LSGARHSLTLNSRIGEEWTTAIIGWIIFGLVVGVIARFLMPGNQPMGFVMTILLGVAGASVGGYIASLVSGSGLDMAQPSGWIGAVAGVLLLLFLYGMTAKSKV